MFLSRIGAYSILPGTKSVIDSLSYTVDLLKDTGNVAAIFPQGEIESAYTSRIRFEKGTSVYFESLRFANTYTAGFYGGFGRLLFAT